MPTSRRAWFRQVVSGFERLKRGVLRRLAQVRGGTPPGAVVAPEIPVLFITYHFPPDAAVGGKRAARFCRYLPSFQVRPVVLTAKEEFYRSVDTSYPVPSGIAIERTRVLRMAADWYMLLKRSVMGGGGATSLPARSDDRRPAAPSDAQDSGFLRRNLLALLDFPDPYWGWYWPAVRAGARVVRRDHVRAIVSSAPPWTAHVIAGRLSRRFGIPWIADFRDVWVDAWRERRRMPGWRMRLQKRLRASWVRRASLVLCSTDAGREVFLAQFPNEPAAKFVTLTNGFDGAAPVREPAQTVPRARVALHSGNLYGGRNVDGLCRAVARLVASNRVNAAEFKLVFLGSNNPEIEASARAAAPELFDSGCIEFRPSVPWAEAQRAVAEASVLLVVQGHHPIAVPAKFYEYLQTGKPIFAVVCEGALSRMVESTGAGVWAVPDDVPRLAEGLHAALQMSERPASELATITRQFHYRFLTERLADYIRQVSQERTIAP